MFFVTNENMGLCLYIITIKWTKPILWVAIWYIKKKKKKSKLALTNFANQLLKLLKTAISCNVIIACFWGNVRSRFSPKFHRLLLLHRKQSIPQWNVTSHIWGGCVIITPLYGINFFKGVCLRNFPLWKIVGPPWKEGEIRLGVDKHSLFLTWILSG